MGYQDMMRMPVAQRTDKQYMDQYLEVQEGKNAEELGKLRNLMEQDIVYCKYTHNAFSCVYLLNKSSYCLIAVFLLYFLGRLQQLRRSILSYFFDGEDMSLRFCFIRR